MSSDFDGALFMATHGKKYIKAREALGEKVSLHAKDALAKMKELTFAKFDETVNVNVNLGIDASKGDQVVRGAVLLPHGTGRKARVIVFAKGEYVDQAQAAGADAVGADDLIEKVLGGWMEFEYAVATPDLMGAVGKLAKILGPRGMLPNKKTGTVTFDVAPVVADLKKGQVFFKTDKAGIVHSVIGKMSFGVDKLDSNLTALLKAIIAAKPAGAKGKFLRKVTLSSTMGPGIPVVLEESLKV